MRKTKIFIFTLVTIWLALYAAIALSHTPYIGSPTVVSGVNMQRTSYTPSLALIEQRFQTDTSMDQAYMPQPAMSIPVTGSIAGEAWIGALILFSAVAVVGISGWLLIQRA